jgi:dihydroorotate dehydrogenase
MAAIFNTHGIDGLIATNTTISRTPVQGIEHATQDGGLSGAPLLDLANKTLSAFRSVLDPGIPIIGVGGICKPEDAAAKFELGASLIQFYTGFIYAGPDLIGDSVDALRSCVADTGR